MLLADRLEQKDPRAFEELVREYGPRMLATARRIVGRTEAEDVVQEAFLSVHRSFDTFQRGAKLSTWLHRIVVNAALMRLRRKRTRPEESIESLLPAFDDVGHYLEAAIDWSAGADVALENKQTREMVQRALGALPEQYREVFILRDVEQLDTAEVAVLLALKPNAVKVRLHRARMALRTLIERELLSGGPRGSR